MKKAKRLSLALIVFSLFSISCLVSSVSAQEGPPGGPPGEMGPPGDEDPCMNMPPGEAQDECYINLDEDLGPEDAHCEEMHEGKNLPEPTEADIARYEAEYRANMKNGGPGRLNESTYAELQGKGFSRAEIDCHVNEMAEAAMHDAEADEPLPPEVANEGAPGAPVAGQPGMPGGQPGMPGDPCMVVPAGPNRDACYATTPPLGQPGIPGGQPGMPGDPCMAVPAGPDRDACHATMPPPGQPGMPGGQPGMQGDPCMVVPAGPNRDACYATTPPPGQSGMPGQSPAGASHCAQFTGAPRAACEAAAGAGQPPAGASHCAQFTGAPKAACEAAAAGQ